MSRYRKVKGISILEQLSSMSVQNLPWRDVELKFLWKISLVAVLSADYVMTGFFCNFK